MTALEKKLCKEDPNWWAWGQVKWAEIEFKVRPELLDVYAPYFWQSICAISMTKGWIKNNLNDEEFSELMGYVFAQGK